LDAQQAQEDAPINDDSAIDTLPTRREVLQATSIINRYIETLPDPLARKLEVNLASLGRQMRLEQSQLMTPTHLTNYFTRK